jgi:hypothetical protein
MVPVLMLVGIMSYMMYTQGQDPLMPLKSVASGLSKQFKQAGKAVSDTGSKIVDGSVGQRPTLQRIYSWVDEQGITHFGTSRPVGNVGFSTVHVDPNANVMDALNVPVKVLAKEKSSITKAPEPNMAAAMPMTANPMEVKKMMKDIEKINAARMQQIDQIH